MWLGVLILVLCILILVAGCVCDPALLYLRPAAGTSRLQFWLGCVVSGFLWLLILGWRGHVGFWCYRLVVVVFGEFALGWC